MNKIVKQKADLKDQQTPNYHQQQNVKLREGSSSVETRRRQISSVFTKSSTSKNSRFSYETISNSSRSQTPNNRSSRSRSFTPLKSVKQRKPTPIPKPIKKGPQPCYFWMQGRCNKFEQCERKHYQTSQIIFKQDKMENKINQEQTNNQKILVKVEQTTILNAAELVEITQRDINGLSKAIKISYKNKKALNKLKNALNKNQKDPYITNEQKKAKEKEILNELLTNTQIDNKNKNALNIKEKKERTKKEQREKALILKNKPKITFFKESEEKQIQIQQLNQNYQFEENKGEIQESDDKSDDEIDMTDYNQINQQSKKLMNEFNQSQQNQDNNSQLYYQSNQNNTSQQINEFQTQNNQTILNPKAQKYINILQSSSQQDQSSEEQSFSNQIPQTLMSSTYIQEKDKQKADKKIYLKSNKSTVWQEVQQDLKWSQNIKSSFNQWKQLRDGKDQINIHPSSEEPTKQSPLNSIEQQDTIEKSKQKMLSDWKMIYKSKAKRNDTLQNFINQQNPKLDLYDNLKVFNLATDYMIADAYINQYHKVLSQITELTNQQKVIGILNIFYNKEFLDKSLQEYTDEISEHFTNATESPGKSHFFKMTQVIDRYIKKLLQISMKTKIEKSENQKLTMSTEQNKTNINTIIELLRHIILQNNTSPFQMYYTTNIGQTFITFSSHLTLDWQQVYESGNKK